MACKRCPSKTQRKFSAEMNIHFPQIAPCAAAPDGGFCKS